jgi:hypothetical protein
MHVDIVRAANAANTVMMMRVLPHHRGEVTPEIHLGQ